MTRQDLLDLMLADALNAVEHFYGPEGLGKVVDQMKRINRGRESRLEMDALDAAITIADPGKMPCDCITQMDGGGWITDCYCQNHDDGERSAAWCEGKNICEKIARLKTC
jgi:hypothetical protein